MDVRHVRTLLRSVWNGPCSLLCALAFAAHATPAQAVVILHNIFEASQRALNLPEAMAPLSAEVVEALSRVAPRRQRQLLREAIGRALYAGRREITGDDLRLPTEADVVERRMGF